MWEDTKISDFWPLQHFLKINSLDILEFQLCLVVVYLILIQIHVKFLVDFYEYIDKSILNLSNQMNNGSQCAFTFFHTVWITLLPSSF